MTPALSALEPTVDRDRERSGWDILSLLRFCLAFIVALTHLRMFAPLGLLGWVNDLGSFEAILGFLLISGYSIGHSIQKKPVGFLRRRMLRIYPVYLAATALTYAIERNAPTGAFFTSFVLNLFFLGQIVQRWSYVDAAWSLDLEVWLYCLAPWFSRLRGHVLELLIAGSFACYTVYTCGRSLFHWPHYAGTIGGINLPCLAFIWIAGFYLATTVGSRTRALRIAGWLFIGHQLLAMGIQLVHRVKVHEASQLLTADLPIYLETTLLLVAIYAIFTGVIAGAFHLTLFQRRICRFLGDISYPLYLVHVPAFKLAAPYARNAPVLLLVALLMATAVYYACDFYSQHRKLA